MGENNRKTVVFGAGCFWGVEELIRKVNGVMDTEVGYSGGTLENPTYKDVCTGTTGHAECVRIEYDASVLNLNELARLFFKLHDPTTVNQQGNDRGTQYRSVIFYEDEEQKKIFEDIISEVERSKKWNRPIVTTLEASKKFYPAESNHQDYLQKFPNGYTCHYWRD